MAFWALMWLEMGFWAQIAVLEMAFWSLPWLEDLEMAFLARIVAINGFSGLPVARNGIFGPNLG